MPRTDDPRASYRVSEYRRSQTPRNLIGALVICLGIALVIAFFIARNDATTPTAEVDFASIAAEAQPAASAPLVVPTLPSGWTANTARWQSASGGAPAQWYISVLTASGTQISVTQAIGGDATWVYQAMGNRQATGTTSIGGETWQTYGASETESGIRYGLSLLRAGGGSGGDPGSALAMYGSASNDDFATLATAILASTTTPASTVASASASATN